MNLAGILASRTTGEPPAFLGKRFDAEGQPLPCSGNTIIGHLRDPASAAFAVAVDHIAAGSACDCWAWRLASSHHMTMFDLVQHERREPECWPNGLAVDAPPQEADRFMLARLRGFDPQTDPVFSMCVQALEAHASACGRGWNRCRTAKMPGCVGCATGWPAMSGWITVRAMRIMRFM